MAVLYVTSALAVRASRGVRMFSDANVEGSP